MNEYYLSSSETKGLKKKHSGLNNGFIHYLAGLFGTSIVTSSRLNQPVEHCSTGGYGFKSRTGLNFFFF